MQGKALAFQASITTLEISVQVKNSGEKKQKQTSFKAALKPEMCPYSIAPNSLYLAHRQGCIELRKKDSHI